MVLVDTKSMAQTVFWSGRSIHAARGPSPARMEEDPQRVAAVEQHASRKKAVSGGITGWATMEVPSIMVTSYGCWENDWEHDSHISWLTQCQL